MMPGMSEVTTAPPGDALPALTGPAERRRVIGLLRAHEPELRRLGVRRLRLFGSVARGEADLASDIDLIAEIDHRRVAFTLVDLVGLERRLGRLLGRAVQVATAPEAMRPYVRESVERDAVKVF